MAATAADALSMDPPSMIVSVNRSASLHAPLSAGANFCINVLSRQQEEISRACGGKLKGEERFALGKWLEGVAGVTVLVDRSEERRVGNTCVRRCRSRWAHDR